MVYVVHKWALPGPGPNVVLTWSLSGPYLIFLVPKWSLSTPYGLLMRSLRGPTWSLHDLNGPYKVHTQSWPFWSLPGPYLVPI